MVNFPNSLEDKLIRFNNQLFIANVPECGFKYDSNPEMDDIWQMRSKYEIAFLCLLNSNYAKINP